MGAEMLTILRHPTRLGALAILEAAQLPTADLSDGHLDHFFYLGPPAAPTGLIGCEIHGSDGLLRSLVVTPVNHGAGTGSALVEHVEAYARKEGVRVMYLLTTTAAEFFARRGYSSVDRNQVPDSIRSTSEYSGLCPVSSTIMVKHL